MVPVPLLIEPVVSTQKPKAHRADVEFTAYDLPRITILPPPEFKFNVPSTLIPS